MHYALLDDGRKVIVDDARQPSRTVKGQTFFLDTSKHTCVLLDGGWQVVRNDKLRKLDYGNPFGGLR